MKAVLDRVRTMWLAAGAIGATTVGGGLLVLVLIADRSPAAALAVLLLTVGHAAFAFTLFLVLRREHDVGQTTLRRANSIAKKLKAGRGADAAALERMLEEHRRELIRDVDARIVGLYELLRDSERR